MLSVVEVDPQGADALALLREASIDAKALYPELFATDSPPASNPPLGARSVYMVAYLDATPVACGAFRLLDESTAEIRRIYVHRDHRRKGLARAVFAHLERAAIRLDYRRLALETGYKQTPAMGLYEALGFRRIAPFGEYLGDPTSVCYERLLDLEE